MEQKQEDTQDLVAKHKELSEKIATIPSEKEMKSEIIELLHKYNDVKDAAQTVIGAIANAKGVTFKSIHQELNLPLDS